MLPILVSLGPIRIYSYGVFMAIGLFVALYFWWKMGRDEHFDEIALFDGFFLSVITFLIAGRLGYVALHSASVGTIYRTLAILAYPGINGPIGIVAVTILLVLFARAHDWEAWKVSDAYAVALSIVLAIGGGIGGLLNGSNPGRQVSWGIMYPGQSSPIIPVDAWILIWALVTFAVVSRVRKNFRFYAWYKGEASTAQEGLASLVFAMSCGIYFAVAGWIDQINWKIGVLPGEFLLGLLIILTSAYLIIRRVGRREDSIWSKLSNIIRRK